MGQALREASTAELHLFSEIRAAERHAVSTPADVLFHVRARRMDMCFELVTQIMERMEEQSVPLMRHMAFATSMIVTYWDSLMGRKIPTVRLHLADHRSQKAF